MIVLLRRLLRDRAGSMLIETAIAAPVLVTLALGTFEVARIVERQQELQSAAAEAEIIALATGSGASANAAQVEAILKTSLGFTTAGDEDKVDVQGFYRCDATDTAVATATGCDTDPDDEDVVSGTPYYHIQLQDSYTPTWTQFGVGGPVSFSVERWVLVPPYTGTPAT
jgi:Flp pilus assembly protein TadG